MDKRQVKAQEYKLLSKLFFKLLPYQILLIVINAVNGIINSLYASNMIGEDAMSAIGLFGPFNHFLYAASMMFVSGSQILYGRYLTRDRSRINGLFTVNLLASAGLALLTAAVLVVGVVTNATKVFVSEPQVLTLFNRYIIGQAIGIPALVVGQQFFAFLSLENQTKRTMAASLVCLAANAVLDHILVVIFPMDTLGLGISTAASTWIFLLVLAFYYMTGKSEWKLTFSAARIKEALKIIRLGYPGALSRFCEMFRCLIVNFLLLQYVGSVGISAFAASNSFLAVIWAVPFGMVAVARMLFSISIGEQDRQSLVNVIKIVLVRCMIIMIGVSAALIIFAEPLTRLFYQDAASEVYQMTVMGFRILPLCMPPALVSLTFACYAQTMEKKKLSVILPIIDGAVGVVVCSFILIPFLKLNGLYIANVLNGVICFAVIWINALIERKRAPKTVEDLMAIPETFGADEDHRIDVSVRSIDEVMNVSREITEFCQKCQIDKRRTTFASLCMEEMAGNVVEHGFTKDSKSHSIDIRVSQIDDQIILRIRDNCTAFNPIDRVKSMECDDMGKNIGIKTVYSIAKEVDYQNLLGLNVLTIKI